MKVKTIYILELSEKEAQALKKLVGSFNDSEFAKLGITGEDREFMHEIYDSIIDEKDIILT